MLVIKLLKNRLSYAVKEKANLLGIFFLSDRGVMCRKRKYEKFRIILENSGDQ